MSVQTLPANGDFTFKCAHCEFDTNKPPYKKHNKGQDFTLFFCGQCKESTLIRFDCLDPINATCTVFKVIT